jgi:hypothetical protein
LENDSWKAEEVPDYESPLPSPWYFNPMISIALAKEVFGAALFMPTVTSLVRSSSRTISRSIFPVAPLVRFDCSGNSFPTLHKIDNG